jgi:hypothetical protein
MKKFFLIIVLIIFNKSSEQSETQDWKSMRDQFVSSIQTMILMFKFSNYELYETYKEYFDMTETIIKKINQIDSIEQFSEEIEALFSNDFMKIIIELIPKEYKDYYDKMLNYFRKIVDYYNKNKKFIDDFIQGNNNFIEEQKSIIDKGTVERNKGNYTVDDILNLGTVESLLLIFIIVILSILIFIGKCIIEKMKLERNLKNKLFDMKNNEVKETKIIKEIIKNKKIKETNIIKKNKEINQENINKKSKLKEPLIIQELGDLGLN